MYLNFPLSPTDYQSGASSDWIRKQLTTNISNWNVFKISDPYIDCTEMILKIQQCKLRLQRGKLIRRRRNNCYNKIFLKNNWTFKDAQLCSGWRWILETRRSTCVTGHFMCHYHQWTSNKENRGSWSDAARQQKLVPPLWFFTDSKHLQLVILAKATTLNQCKCVRRFSSLTARLTKYS